MGGSHDGVCQQRTGVERVRQLPQALQCRIVLYSGTMLDAHDRMWLPPGVPVLMKPVEVDELRAMVLKVPFL